MPTASSIAHIPPVSSAGRATQRGIVPTAQAARRRWARWPKTFRAILLSACLLASLEAGLRVRAWFRHGSARVVANIYEPDEQLGRRLRPGSTLTGMNRHLTVNRWGFRGADLPKSKPPGTLRLAAIGSSTTFGLEASSDETVWVARMTRSLDDGSLAQRVDAINAGVPGYTLGQSETQLRNVIAPFKPDVVVVYHVSTSIAAHGRRQFAITERAGSSTASLGFLRQHSLLLQMIRVNSAAFGAAQTPTHRHDRLDQRGLEAYVKQLTSIIAYSRRQGWSPVLCTCPRAFGDPSAPSDQHELAATTLAHNPALSLVGLDDAFTRYNEAVRAVARTENVPLVDLDAIVPKRRTYFVDALHLNDAGHALVGASVADTIRTMMDDRTNTPSAIARGKP